MLAGQIGRIEGRVCLGAVRLNLRALLKGRVSGDAGDEKREKRKCWP
jgi:hypothetical protein